jgi:serine/threonine protein kinase
MVTGDSVALKRIFIRSPEDGIPLNVVREYKCLQLIEHPNVVRILDVFPSVRFRPCWHMHGFPVDGRFFLQCMR